MSADARLGEGDGGAVALDDPLGDGPADEPGEERDGDGVTDARRDRRVGDGDDGDPVVPEAGPPHDPPSLPLSSELARVTGLLLVVLLPLHLVTVLLADPTEVDRLLDRWDNRWWLLADWGFLTVGLSHSLLSVRERMHRLGSGSTVAAACPHCGGALPATDDRFGIVAYRLLLLLTVALYLAASWAMLRLV
jgi:hypothetical protein